ncbi:alpha-mannosidase [Desulfurococcaceae archaeon MEX13E-LK6-19]|nr:alpha-mannosidase [Desulfurococcaceae archaeon MEX13E-LK6-19]
MLLRKIRRIAFELLAASIQEFKFVKQWRLNGKTITLPYVATKHEDEFRFTTSLNVPNNGLFWFLKIATNGNGLVKINGTTWSGIDDVHTYIPIRPGHSVVELILSPRKLFGYIDLYFEFKTALLIGVAWKPYIVANRVLSLTKFIESLPANDELREELTSLLTDIMLRTRIVPNIKQVTLALILLYTPLHLNEFQREDLITPSWDHKALAGLYGKYILENLYEDLTMPSMESVVNEATRIEEELYKGLEKLRKKYPNRGLLYICGHSHIDAAWLWSYNETKRKLLRTFSTIVRYLELYPNITFVQSSAQYYKWIEDIDKELFSKIREFINKNKWIPVGGMWVESDVQLITGESIARQFLYGQKYFLEKFGKIAKIGWLPDTFGFPASLPQIMKKSGIEVFITHKVMWNQINKFPYHTFIWEGIDGTKIPVQIIITNYNEILTPDRIYNYWKKYNNKNEAPFSIVSYGYGDGGGGPTLEMIENIEFINKLPLIPQIKSIDEEEYIKKVKEIKNRVPIWTDELYLEMHRGTYTTNLTIKKLMAEAESLLRSAEIASTIAEVLGLKQYPMDKIESLWKRVLLHQFHDVLPGSSVKETYDYAIDDLRKVINEAKNIIDTSLSPVAGKDEIIIYNDLPWPRSGVIILDLDNVCLEDLNGNPLECQSFEGKTYVYVDNIPPLGYVVYRLTTKKADKKGGVRVFHEGDDLVLENEKIRVKINSKGELVSLFDKEYSREMIKDKSNVLIAHPDRPNIFDAWDVDEDFLSYGEELSVLEKPRIVCDGPIVGCIEYTKGFGKSRIKQRICIYKSSKVIDFKNIIDWKDKLVLVKAWFNINVNNKTVHYEIPYGVIERSSQRNTSWEKAKFEVPALRWADVSDGIYGVAIISPARHGYSAIGSKIGLSLLKSPIFPNPWSDLGQEEFTYHLYPHQGDWMKGKVPNKALEVWSPLKVIYPKNHNIRGEPIKSYTLLEITPASNIELGTVKKSEDKEGYLIRICNLSKAEASILLKIPAPIEKILETNIIETQILGEHEVNEQKITLKLKPYEIKTLKLIVRLKKN